MDNREEICARGAKALEENDPAAMACVLGFDGFVDSIIDVVDKRHSAKNYERVETIKDMVGKVAAAVGESANYELVTKMQKLGGNGPIMANALVAAGFGVTSVGAFGKPEVHKVFAELGARSKIYSVCEPGYTDALEFTDGKLMLGKLTSLAEVTYENLVATVGKERMIALLSEARLIGMLNWTMLPNVTELWKRVLVEMMPRVKRDAGRIIFIDLADPEKRTVADLVDALQTLAGFQAYGKTILGLNLKESGQVAKALGIEVVGEAEGAIEKTAAAIRARLQIACVVIHPRRGAAAADAGGTALFAGPFVAQPKISTGAGDHFNAGFCMGQMLGLGLAESICIGTAVSGFYVRNAKSPTQGELVEFLRHLPAAEGVGG